MNGRSQLLPGGIAALLLASLSLPGVALANEVVLPPLIPKGPTKDRDVANLTSLLSSELDFMPDVDRVIELDRMPSTLNAACLNQAACLAKIGREAGGSRLLAGTLQMADAGVTFDLVWFDVSASRVIRRQSFQVPNRPEAIADSMDDVVRELVTGKAATAKEEDAGGAAVSLFDLDDEDDDFAFDEADFEIAKREEEQRKREAEARAQREAEEARRRQAEEARRREAEERARKEAEERARREAEERARKEAEERARREAEERARKEAEERARREAEERARREAEERARREAEEARRRDAELARQREAEDARRRAADDARRREAEEARRAASASTMTQVEDDDDDFDPDAISFGAAPLLVVEEDDEDDFELPPVADTGPQRGSTYFTEEEPPPRPSRIVDLDDDEPIGKSPREKAPKPSKDRGQSNKSSSFEGDPSLVQIKLRGGYSPYYRLGFVTYGGEISVRLGESGLHLLAGLEGWSVQRNIPERFQQPGMPTTAWNTIFPVNLGAIYKVDINDGQVRPYVGADLIGAQYYVPEDGSGSKLSIGARARGGIDYMLSKNFGLNADLAVGFWTGGEWEIIERDVKNSGLLPQISGGIVIAF
ncbi:MAG: hypothetical protein EA397_04665 [Deltaproteobacteria bacterium]|nr:MAG: hypothetical protein EA397_04665 [Deltaproteobacteria bacterium]